MEQGLEKRNSTDIKLLLQIEKYKAEIVRLEGVRNGENSKRWKEYFQGHIDSLTGTIIDLEALLK